MSDQSRERSAGPASRGADRGDPCTVADVMKTDVVTAPADLPLGDFVRLLTEERISGTPVVDEAGDVVGVASYADVVRAARRQTEAALDEGGEAAGPPCAPPADAERGSTFFRAPGRGPELVELLHHQDMPEDLGDCTVGDVMTPALFWVRPEASLAEAASLLSEVHVHRALVFDGDALVGIVTAFDLLAELSRGGGPEAEA